MSIKYWIDGLPFGELKNANDAGTQKYWFDGLPHYSIGTSTVINLKHWNGTVWEDATLKHWNGSVWESTTLKSWSGSAWV